MVCSRVFGLLAITLCLLTCLCESSKVSQEEAMQVVNEAKKIAKEVLDKAKEKRTEAATLLNDAEMAKRNAESAAKEAEKLAQVYPKAKPIAAAARTAANEVLKLHTTAFQKARAATSSMGTILSEVKVLEEKIGSQFWVGGGENNDFSRMKTKAESVKTDVKALETKIDGEEATRISEARSAQTGMAEQVEKAQLAKYHVDCIAAVAKTETMLEEAKASIACMEENKDEIDATVKEMKSLYTQAPATLKTYIQSLSSTTEGSLKSVTSAIEKVKEAQKEMLKQKQAAADALEKVKTANNAESAKRDAGTATLAAREAESKVEEIKTKVVQVKTHAFNVLARKKSAEKSINTGEIVVVTNKNVTPNPSNKGDENAKDATEGPVSIANTIYLCAPLLLSLATCIVMH